MVIISVIIGLGILEAFALSFPVFSEQVCRPWLNQSDSYLSEDLTGMLEDHHWVTNPGKSIFCERDYYNNTLMVSDEGDEIQHPGNSLVYYLGSYFEKMKALDIQPLESSNFLYLSLGILVLGWLLWMCQMSLAVGSLLKKIDKGFQALHTKLVLTRTKSGLKQNTQRISSRGLIKIDTLEAVAKLHRETNTRIESLRNVLAEKECQSKMEAIELQAYEKRLEEQLQEVRREIPLKEDLMNRMTGETSLLSDYLKNIAETEEKLMNILCYEMAKRTQVENELGAANQQVMMLRRDLEAAFNELQIRTMGRTDLETTDNNLEMDPDQHLQFIGRTLKDVKNELLQARTKLEMIVSETTTGSREPNSSSDQQQLPTA